MLNRRRLVLGGSGAAVASLFAGCGGGGDDPAASAATLGGGAAPGADGYRQTSLVASDADTVTFAPTFPDADRDAEFFNAWGIAIRPAGAGGHFWVAAGGWSFEFVGDVTASSDASVRTLFQDALTLVRIPGAGVPEGEPDVTNLDKFVGFTTGVVFNGAALDSDRFVVRGQKVLVDGVEHTLQGAARFLFATDSGVISGLDRARCRRRQHRAPQRRGSGPDRRLGRSAMRTSASR